MIQTFTVETGSRCELVDITSIIRDAIRSASVESGIVHIFVPHTTAAVTINENADPDVKRDLIYKLNKEIPQDDGYHHAEGNSDAHLKASLFGFSEQIMVENGQPVLGTWQGVYFCEFDGPRRRQVKISVTSFG